MKKGSRKKRDDQIDEYNMPTEPLPDLGMSFPPADQRGFMPGGRVIQPPFTPYQGAQQPPPVYPYLQSPSSTDGRPPYYPSWPDMPARTDYGVWPIVAGDLGNTKIRPTRQRRFLPACVGLFFLCVQLLLIVRFGIRLLNLPLEVTWVSVVTSVSAIFVLPFQVLWFQMPVAGTLVPTNIEVYTLIAILTYGVLSRLLVGILKVLLKSR